MVNRREVAFTGSETDNLILISAMADDEEIIKRRLLFDGDGTGEERKTNLLLRKFYKWCNLDPTTDEGLSAYNQVVSMLAQCEFSYSKSRCIRKMTEAECIQYETVKAEMKTEIDQATLDSASIREELIKADNYRKNNLEYEAVAKNIKKHPDRKQSQRRLLKLHTDIYQYKEKLEKLKQKLEKRRKQVRIVMNSLEQLHHSIEMTESDADIQNKPKMSNKTASSPEHLKKAKTKQGETKS